MKNKQYYHLYADGDDAQNFIVSYDDFLAAMNLFGVCAANSDIRVLAFNIEDTHPHALLYGCYEECLTFKRMFESSYCHHIVQTRGNMDGVLLDITLYPIEDEYYLRNVGTYIIIQPTKDGKDILPFDYKWGSACLYFRRGPYVPPWYFDAKGNIMSPRPLSSYTYDRKRAILHSRHAAPDEWLVCNDILLPSNYIDVGRFESIYATCNRYRVFLSSSRQRDEPIRQKMAEVRGVSLDYQEARRTCGDTCMSLYGLRDPRKLKATQRMTLAVELRKKLGLSFKQLAALVRLPKSEIEKYVK